MTGVNGTPPCHWNRVDRRHPPATWSSGPWKRKLAPVAERQFVEDLTDQSVRRVEVR